MRAYEIGDQKGIASLRLTGRPDPEPAPGEVVVKVRAVCLIDRVFPFDDAGAAFAHLKSGGYVGKVMIQL